MSAEEAEHICRQIHAELEREHKSHRSPWTFEELEARAAEARAARDYIVALEEFGK